MRWPILWAFVDLDNSPSITDLLVKRSESAPLTLLWRTPPGRRVSFEEAPSKSYFVNHAESILSRLRSLNVFATYSNFISIYHVIRDSKLPLLQLRDLTIVLFRLLSGDEDRLTPPPLTPLIDNSRIRDIELWGLDLPWLELPHNKLTHLTLKDPLNPPALSHLLNFLSNCPLLEALDLAIQDCDYYRIKTVFAPMTLTSLRTIDLPYLTRLQLEAQGRSSYDYIQQFASRTRTLGKLSFFKLIYNLKYLGPSDDGPATGSHPDQHNTPFQTLGAIPSGAFSHFSQYQYLTIGFGDEVGLLGIRGHTSISDHHGSSDLPGHPFIITCTGLELPIIYAPILELIYAMPQLRHLTIRFHAWRILTLPNFDARKAFPSLRTLVLTDCGTEALNSLPADLRVKRFILASCTISFAVLLDVVASMGVEILELTRCYDTNFDTDTDEIISTLQGWGVDVVWEPPDESDESDGSEW